MRRRIRRKLIIRWTHAVIHLYTKEKYVPEQPTTDYLIPGFWLNTNDHYSYLIGYSDGTVRPNGKITRAEVATIFFRLLDDDTQSKVLVLEE